jgi:hypothetical protein
MSSKDAVDRAAAMIRPPRWKLTDRNGRKWKVRLFARGVMRDAPGALGAIFWLGSVIWHLAKYPGEWELEVKPLRGDWPRGLQLPEYVRGASSWPDCLKAVTRLADEIRSGAWPTKSGYIASSTS